MIRVIENMPLGTIGLEAVGKVTEDDYRDVLLPAVSAALERGDVTAALSPWQRLRLVFGRRSLG
jgi:hypothetical protein